MRFSHRRDNQLYKIEATIGRDTLKCDFLTVGGVTQIGVLMIMLILGFRQCTALGYYASVEH